MYGDWLSFIHEIHMFQDLVPIIRSLVERMAGTNSGMYLLHILARMLKYS